MEDVIFKRDGQVEVITLNRPDIMNCFNNNMLYALARRFDELHQDDDCRAVVVTGEGSFAELPAGLAAPVPADCSPAALADAIERTAIRRPTAEIAALITPFSPEALATRLATFPHNLRSAPRFSLSDRTRGQRLVVGGYLASGIRKNPL